MRVSDSTKTNWEVDDQPRRCWVNDEDDMMRCYLGGMKGRVPLGELLDHFAKKYPHVDVRTVELNYCTAVWEEPSTEADRAQRQAWRKHHADRIEKWERETYARLKAKYGK